MYHLPTYFLQYPSNISILMLLFLRCLKHSEYLERFDRKTLKASSSYLDISYNIHVEYFYLDVAVSEVFETLRMA